MHGRKARAPCGYWYISTAGPRVSLWHWEPGQVIPEAHVFSGTECDILMIPDSSQLRVFSFAVRYVGALETETKGTGRAVRLDKWGLGMCLTDKNKMNSRQVLGEQTSVGGRLARRTFTELFMGPHSYITR